LKLAPVVASSIASATCCADSSPWQSAAMAGPDYTWWHGLFDVAQHFYSEFLPQAEELKPGVSDPILQMPYHQWRKGLSKEQIQQILQWYQQKYQPGGGSSQ
jgi:hypothetical protein